MPTNTPPTLMQLFTTFLRLGLTAFGGPSMIAYIRTLTVQKKGWLDAKLFGDGVALCQMIPGATVMQITAYIGLKTRGLPGACVAYIAFALPAFVLMMFFAATYTRTHDFPLMVAIFSGLQAIIVAIVANATWSFGKTTLKNWKMVVIACAAAILFGLNVNPIITIILAALAGLLLIRTSQAAAGNPVPINRAKPYTNQLLLIIAAAALGLILLFLFDRALFDLAALMFRIDLFAFGGGFSTLPLMLHEVVEVRHWIDGQTFMNGIVLGQITPGPIVITATFVGYLIGGAMGGFVASIGIFLPSFLMLVGVSPYFDRIRTSPMVNRAIIGVLCSFVGLLLTVTVRFALDVQCDWPHLLLLVSALVALLLKADLLWVVATGILVSAFAIG